jgi:thymidylate kinase
MKRSEVMIAISGAAGTGKTAIAQIIYEALIAHGIQPFEFPQDVEPGRSQFDLGVAIGSLKAGVFEVTLREVLSARARP